MNYADGNIEGFLRSERIPNDNEDKKIKKVNISFLYIKYISS